MAPYRIYLLDETDHISGVVEEEYASDHEALAAAMLMPKPKSNTFVEVWQYARCLGKVCGA